MYVYADSGVTGRDVGERALEDETGFEVGIEDTVDGTIVDGGTVVVELALTEIPDVALELNEADTFVVLADETLVDVGVVKRLPLDAVVDVSATEVVVLDTITALVGLELVTAMAVLVETTTVDVELDATTAELDVIDSKITLTELLGKLASNWYIIILLDPPQYWLLLPLHGKLHRLESTNVVFGFRVNPQLHSCAYSSPKYG